MRRSGPRIVLGIAVAAMVAAGVGWWVVKGRAGGEADLIGRARSAYEGHDWAVAADLARRRLKEEPDDDEAIRVLARASARRGRDKAANTLFARLGVGELRAEDCYLLGVGLDHLGRRAEAVRMWERAVAMDGDHAEALDRLARAYAVASRPDEAARLAERLAHRPGWELRGELVWGTLRFGLDDPAGAAEVVTRALRRPQAAEIDDAALAHYRKLAARALLRVGQPAEARAWLVDRVGGPMGDPESSWLLSRSALQEGAIPEFREALRSAGSYRDQHRMEQEPGPYAGESACAECHPAIATAHRAGRHASTLVRGPDLASIPYPDRPVPDPDDPAVVHRFARDGDSIRFETEEAGAIRSAVVAYAFGSPDHYVSLVGPDEKGRPYILRLSRYATGKESGWVRTTGHTPDAAGGREQLGKALDGPDALYRCLFCHATSPRAVLDGNGPVSRDRAIGCERCHGPGAMHIKSARGGLGDPAIVDPSDASAPERMQLCAQCHAMHRAPASPPPRTDPYWIRFQSTTLAWSRCYTESDGAMDCMTCHDPHHDRRRPESEQIARCLDCHAPTSIPDRARSGSPSPRRARGATCPVDPARGCIGCHMPPFESAPLHATFTDHYIRVHPGRKDQRASRKGS